MPRIPFHGDYSSDELIRRMKEPEYLKELRRQAERIRVDNKRRRDSIVQEMEADALRREIRQAGHNPCF